MLQRLLFTGARRGRIAFAGVAIAVAGTAAAFAAHQPAATLTTASPKYIAGTCNTWNTPFCDAAMTPPVTTPPYAGHVFRLAQNYPRSARPDRDAPWLRIQPKTDPGAYTRAVLAYFYEGNIHRGSIENDFEPKLNHVRAWYNAPFQDLGPYGREFVHGLTVERLSPPGELAPEQTSYWMNYAVGFYNAPGATVLRRVWDPWRAKAGAQPSTTAAVPVPEGTVAAKLLFTTGSTDEVPFLKDAPAWDAYVYADLHSLPKKPQPGQSPPPRVIGKVHLLQIDIAVKDHRAGPTGWFFGTFVAGGGPGYHGPALGKVWRNVAPVGLMWGNDPGYTPPPSPTPYTTGLKETWLNPDVHMLHYGYQNRLNGPVDNPKSACMSCHATAEINLKTPMTAGSGMFAPIPMPTAPATPPPHDIAYWFRNVGPQEPFDGPDFGSTGYSLQVMDGLRNYYTYNGASPPPTAALRAARVKRAVQMEPARPPRDGGVPH
ncbi:MAG TPA: hypothetical protein VGU66_19075 [Candidatus Elarobacter sp.]|nr:hypothetical protein [Candidatus Elarobacter sp.]